VATWTLQDTLGLRAPDIGLLLANVVFNGSAHAATHVATWNGFTAPLPQGMTLEEVLTFLGADDEAEQRQILDAVQRLKLIADETRLRILSILEKMHVKATFFVIGRLKTRHLLNSNRWVSNSQRIF
jgi:hypothetical protein